MGNNMSNNRRPDNRSMQGRSMGRNSNNGGGNNNGSDESWSCEDLIRAIAEADFFAQDLKLYLDTHPDDTRAIEMFREACRQSKACKAAFEDSFYPLTACAAGKDGEWDWLEGIFPPNS